MTHYQLYYPTKAQVARYKHALRSYSITYGYWKAVKKIPEAWLIALFLAARTQYDFMILLGVKPDADEVFTDLSYETFTIPKKKGGTRIIHVPNGQLMELQKRLKYILDLYYAEIRPACSFGFIRQVRKRSMWNATIMGGASKHVGQKMVLNTDLKDFFPTIGDKHLTLLLSGPAFRFPEATTELLKSLLLFQGKQLPIGAPTSPVISNFVSVTMDLTLENWAQSKRMVYTRYADDLSFSSAYFVDKQILKELEKIVQHFGFELNPNKTRWQSRRGRQSVTGIVVNDKASASRSYRKQVRAMRHDFDKNGAQAAAQRHFKLHRAPTEEETAYYVKKLKGMEGFLKRVW